MIATAVVIVIVSLMYSRITVHDSEDRVIRSYRLFVFFDQDLKRKEKK